MYTIHTRCCSLLYAVLVNFTALQPFITYNSEKSSVKYRDTQVAIYRYTQITSLTHTQACTYVRTQITCSSKDDRLLNIFR